MKALTFLLQGRLYGVSIAPVKEIIGIGEITTVPMMPPYLRGIMNLRGHVVPVIDLSVRLGGPPAQTSDRTSILMVECRDDEAVHLLGLLVDAVRDVLSVDTEQLAPAPGFGTRVPSAFIEGMVEHENGSMIVLALERVIALRELEEEVDDALAVLS